MVDCLARRIPPWAGEGGLAVVQTVCLSQIHYLYRRISMVPDYEKNPPDLPSFYRPYHFCLRPDGICRHEIYFEQNAGLSGFCQKNKPGERGMAKRN